MYTNAREGKKRDEGLSMALRYWAHGQARQRNNHDKQSQDSIKGGVHGRQRSRATYRSLTRHLRRRSFCRWLVIEGAQSHLPQVSPPPREVGVTKPCAILVWEWWGGRARGEKIERCCV